jgi:predicted enzyme related to lactoylglutathione lyase
MVFANEICLITDNVPRLVAFYEKVLQTTSEGNEIHSIININSGNFAIYSKSAAIQDMGFNFDQYDGTGRFTFGFSVEDVDIEFQRLKSLNMDIEFVVVPTTHPWGARTMHFRDPDGNIMFFRMWKK